MSKVRDLAPPSALRDELYYEISRGLFISPEQPLREFVER